MRHKKPFPKVRFFGKTTGMSGYSYATKYIARAFSESGIPTYFPSKEPYFKGLSTCGPACEVDFYIHTPPFSRHKSKNYKIGYFYWETDKIPASWAKDICHSLDEIWVPCKLVELACRRAGFSGPIEVVHTPYSDDVKTDPVRIPALGTSAAVLSDSCYVFYSIFQWNVRKGYLDLLSAYLREFSPEENVCLLIKTNSVKHKLHGDSRINRDILDIKSSLGKNSLPPVFLIKDKLSESRLKGVHELGDCFVLPHRGEGWGMPIHDAMNSQSLIITTKFGGITEHLNETNAMIINHTMENVTPMTWNDYYTSDQKWAKPNVDHLKSLMRKAYEKDFDEMLPYRSRRLGESFSVNSFSRAAEDILIRRKNQGAFR